MSISWVVGPDAGAGGLEGEAKGGVDARFPGRRMGVAETPRLHDPLAWHELDLAPLDPAGEEREGITFAICDLGRHFGCGTEPAALGEQLVHLVRCCGDKRFLMDGHHCLYWACAWRRALSAGLPNGLPRPTSR